MNRLNRVSVGVDGAWQKSGPCTCVNASLAVTCSDSKKGSQMSVTRLLDDAGGPNHVGNVCDSPLMASVTDQVGIVPNSS